jgi:SAM-dependent methyltransferase
VRAASGQAETDSARRRYEAWHAALPFDPTGVTPWQRLIREHLDPGRHIADKLVLDVGCGRGELSHWLIRHSAGPRVVAADFALTAVAKGRGHATSGGGGRARIAWGVADLSALPFAGATFDTVFSCETIEHVPSAAGAVNELARVLKPGGTLFLTTPNYANLSGLYRGFLRLRGRKFSEAGQPINHFMILPWTWILVRRSGLRVRRVDGLGHYLPWAPGRPAIELRGLDRRRYLARWFAVQSFVLAEKPLGPD